MDYRYITCNDIEKRVEELKKGLERAKIANYIYDSYMADLKKSNIAITHLDEVLHDKTSFIELNLYKSNDLYDLYEHDINAFHEAFNDKIESEINLLQKEIDLVYDIRDGKLTKEEGLKILIEYDKEYELKYRSTNMKGVRL